MTDWFSDEGSYVKAGVPRAEDFSKALYTLDIGQNDLSAGLSRKTADQLLENVSSITAQLALTIEVTSFDLLLIHFMNHYCRVNFINTKSETVSPQIFFRHSCHMKCLKSPWLYKQIV